MKVIIDTDPGTDDALALIMAMNSPDMEVLGLTTIGGNASLAHTTRNTLRLMEYMGRTDQPVFKGASRPLRGRFEYAYHHHGPAGLTVRLPMPTVLPRDTRAVEYIVSQVRAHPREVTIVALGPLTNVARAMKAEPRLAEWVTEIMVMGGAVEVPGNVTPHAEFNIYNDAAAANLVLASGANVTLVGLDVCDRAGVVSGEVRDFAHGSKGGKLAARIVGNWFKRDARRDGYSLCDPLAMAAVLEPDLLEYRDASVTVDGNEVESVGRTRAAFGEGSVRVAVGVDVPRSKTVISGLLSAGA